MSAEGESMADFRIVECDICGKSRRAGNPYNPRTEPIEFEITDKAQRGWIEGAMIWMNGEDGVKVLTKRTFCGLECLKDALVPENFSY
jgi:hypothetical protein